MTPDDDLAAMEAHEAEVNAAFQKLERQRANLTAKNTKLRADIAKLVAERDADRAEIVALCEERIQLTAERDAQRRRADEAERERDINREFLGAEAATAKAQVEHLAGQVRNLVAERDEARAGWTKAVEIATEASNQRDQALAALETAVDALRSGT